jgi:transketolase
MSEDKSVVKPIEAPPLAPLNIPSKLAPTPAGPPKYAVKVKSAKGEEIVLGDPRATRALVALMDTEAVNGGAACHWGGPAAFAEIMAAIHGLMFATKGRPWHEAFNFVNDAGHTENGIYALRCNYGFDGLTYEDLKAFRSIRSKLTGHGESHLNPQGVLLSNGPLGSALPQSQGLAMADKVRQNDRVTICTVSDGASMEGEAKEAFAALPGLAAKGRLNPYLLIISDNDTKLSGRITKDAYSMEPTFSAMSDLGWNVIKVADGHDLQAVYLEVENGLAQARANPRAPVCLWVKTIKGYGVRATMESSTGGHGFPLTNGEKIIDFVNEIYFGADVPADLAAWALALRRGWEQKEAAKKAKAAPPPAVKKEKVQSGLAKGAVRAAQEGLPVYSISADLAGSTGMSFFQNRGGLFQGGLCSHRRYVRPVRRHQRQSAPDHVRPFPGAGHRRFFPCRLSGRRRRRVARGDDLPGRDLGHPAHRRHRVLLRGRSGSAHAPSDQTRGASPARGTERRVSHIFCRTRELSRPPAGQREL